MERAESIAIYHVREVRHHREVSDFGEAWPAERGYVCAEGSFSIATSHRQAFARVWYTVQTALLESLNSA